MLLIILVFSAKKLKHSSENDPCIYIFYLKKYIYIYIYIHEHITIKNINLSRIQLQKQK
jgi:hypothetical protein